MVNSEGFLGQPREECEGARAGRGAMSEDGGKIHASVSRLSARLVGLDSISSNPRLACKLRP